jgi:tRNA wybutosine-synthesizing protein 1
VASSTEWDEPAIIVDECIKAQHRILSGYKGQVIEGKVDPEKYGEALKPRHVAISLDGEPTLYPNLDMLMHEFKKKGFTVFLVTNGTNPQVLRALRTEPSQLYVSLCAPDKSTFIETCRPIASDAWGRLMETLSILSSFSCPTAVRITLVRNLNLKNVEGYCRLVEASSPTYVEPKSYMYVGYSRRRLDFESMPSHRDILGFSRELAAGTSYRIIDESSESRVALLSRLDKAKKLD